jgi:hypothetical protein
MSKFKKFMIITGSIFVIIVIAAAASGAGKKTTAVASKPTAATTPTSTTPTAAPTTTQAPPPQTPQQAGTGFYNMQTLETDLQVKANLKNAQLGIAARITKVTCFLDGPQLASCNGTASDGSTITVAAHISADGRSVQTNNGS